jgi:hypothetical protein
MMRTGTWLVLTTSILFAPEAIESGDGQVPQIMDKLLRARSYMLSVVAGMRAVRRLALGTDSMHGLFGARSSSRPTPWGSAGWTCRRGPGATRRTWRTWARPA